MFVSNFAVNFEKAMKSLHQQSVDFAQDRAELAQVKACLARAEQELAAAREEIERLKQAHSEPV
jgi:uncharacterized protein (DUF305 family)